MWEGQYYNRPFPKDVFEQVQLLVKESRWSTDARKLCEASDGVKSFEADKMAATAGCNSQSGRDIITFT